jgi:hypothetical protein
MGPHEIEQIKILFNYVQSQSQGGLFSTVLVAIASQILLNNVRLLTSFLGFKNVRNVLPNWVKKFIAIVIVMTVYLQIWVLMVKNLLG